MCVHWKDLSHIGSLFNDAMRGRTVGDMESRKGLAHVWLSGGARGRGFICDFPAAGRRGLRSSGTATSSMRLCPRHGDWHEVVSI